MSGHDAALPVFHASGLRHAGQDGHSGGAYVEDLSFVLALPLPTAVSRLWPFVVVVVYLLRKQVDHHDDYYYVAWTRLTGRAEAGGPGCYE
jgi:hypothetical protein